MGIYSGDNMFSNTMRSVDPDLSYGDGAISAQVIMIENCQNQFALFEGVIRNDIQEATMRINGVDEDEILGFTEGTIGDLLSKIKEMFKKLWSKIKGIFQGFMARLEATFGKNNKQFVEKYRKVVLSKDLADFEPKYRKRTSADYPLFDGVATYLDDKLNTGKYANSDEKAIEKMYDDFDDDKILDEMSKQISSKFTDFKEFDKDFMDLLYDDESTDKVNIHDIISELIGFKDLKKNWSKANDSLNKAFNKMIQQIEKDESSFSKEFPTGKGAIYAKKYGFGKEDITKSGSEARWKKNDEEEVDNTGATVAAGSGWKVSDTDSENSKDKTSGGVPESARKYQKILGLVSKYAHLGQQIATKYTQCVMKALTFGNKQNRTIFAKAVAYNRKKNEEVMMEAMAELAEWEADY